MKLISFSVTNFRSITKAHKIPLSDISILIGKNNEGKSNLLKALNIVMATLKDYAEIRRGPRRRFVSFRSNESNSYVWQRDFPVSLQDRKTSTDSIFRLEFELTDEEIKEFKHEIKSNLNGTLPIKVTIGKTMEPQISVVKGGRGSKTLNSKSKKIAEYISKRVIFNHIPAIRTDEQAMKVVQDIAFSELMTLNENLEYEKALAVIKELQKPVLDELSSKIKTSLCQLLPKIQDVSIEINENRRRNTLRNELDIQIDDGNLTSLEFKGDGVKSLAAMALLKDMSLEKGAISLIAIEEPESHLHPGAIHILRDTIYSLTKTSQVIVSSHNPLFVDRENIKSNIIVESGKVRSAKNIKEIRETIGIKASDNLQNSNYVLIVEGEEDVVALKTLLPTLSEKIKKALNSNLLAIEKIGGAGNLSYKLTLMKSTLCVHHVLLDNDDAGRTAYQKAIDSGELEIKDSTFINCNGMTDSEFEDCLDVAVYKETLENKYGVNLSASEFRNNNKWSDRIAKVFQTQGKLWNDNIEAQVKHKVALNVVKNPNNALSQHKRNSIDALVETLEKKLK